MYRHSSHDDRESNLRDDSEKTQPEVNTAANKQGLQGAEDVFVDEESHQIQYKTLTWQFVSLLMIAEIVSNGMLSLPNAVAVVGIVPSVILTVFLGVFGLFTAKLLIDFKGNHPEVHNMGRIVIAFLDTVILSSLLHQETPVTSCLDQ